MKALKVFFIILAVLFVVAVGLVYAGIFNVAADEPHWALTERVIESLRERSIAVRARGQVPSLDSLQLIAMGAEHYAEMCTGCHLAPGKKDSELRVGLYPKPPNLAEHGTQRSPEQTFWVIKHGVKMTGMPAWGLTHDDRSLWGLVAFVQKLPDLSPQQYEELVGQGRAAGHTHDGHSDEGDEPDHSPDEGAQHDETEDHHNSEDDHEHEGGASRSYSPGNSHSHDEAPKNPGDVNVPAAAAEPVAVVDRFFRELAAGNSKAAIALLDPSVLIYESGGAERSRQEYASHHMGEDAKFLKGVNHRLLSRTGDTVGDLAWVASEVNLSGNFSDKPVNVVSTETMVLRKIPAGWRIMHIHWSSRPSTRTR